MAGQGLGTATVVQGNALALDIADGSVDLIVTSPPYFGLRSYQDGGEHYAGQIGAEATPAEFVDALIAATAEMARVLKPSGSIWVNLGDKYQAAPDPGSWNATKGRAVFNGQPRSKSLTGIPWRYAIACTDRLGLILRAEVIWHKPNGLPESVKDRVRRSHETWFHFTLEPRYFANVDPIREPLDPKNEAHAARYNEASKSYGKANNDRRDGGASNFVGNPAGKLPGSVWSIPTQPLQVPDHLGIDHFAAFPMEWPRRIIRGWSPEGGTVLDPFGGTGTTALVAKAWGRHGISNDMSADYCRLAEWRTNDPKQLEKAAALPKPPKAPKPEPEPAADIDGQANLLDMLGGDAA